MGCSVLLVGSLLEELTMHNAKARDLRHRQFLKVLNQYNTEVGKLGAQNHSSYKRLKNHTHVEFR